MARREGWGERQERGRTRGTRGLRAARGTRAPLRARRGTLRAITATRALKHPGWLHSEYGLFKFLFGSNLTIETTITIEQLF